jgi:hypothetical protein
MSYLLEISQSEEQRYTSWPDPRRGAGGLTCTRSLSCLIRIELPNRFEWELCQMLLTRPTNATFGYFTSQKPMLLPPVKTLHMQSTLCAESAYGQQ